MGLLSQFLLRLAFGLAVGMAITSSRQVTSGFYRNHLYVTLGLTTLAAMVLAKISPIEMWIAIAAAIISYIGSAAWLYEAKRFGKLTLWLVAACSITAAILAQLTVTTTGHLQWWSALSVVTSGLVLGLVFASMLLGHWYLVQPGLRRAALKEIVIWTAIMWPFEVAVFLWPTGVIQMFTGAVDDGYNGLLAWVWLVCAISTIGLVTMTWFALRERYYSAVMAATGLLYLAILTGFGMDLIPRAVLAP